MRPTQAREGWPRAAPPAAGSPASAATAADSKAAHLPNLRQGHLHAPQLALVPQAELADQLELAVQPLLLEGPARLLEGLAICSSAHSSQPQQAACLHAALHVVFHISSQRLAPKQLHQSRRYETMLVVLPHVTGSAGARARHARARRAHSCGRRQCAASWQDGRPAPKQPLGPLASAQKQPPCAPGRRV